MKLREMEEELRSSIAQLVTQTENANPEGKQRAATICHAYLFEFIKRYKTPGMTVEKCRRLSMEATKRRMRQLAPQELAEKLEKLDETVQLGEHPEDIQAPSEAPPWRGLSISVGAVPSGPPPSEVPSAPEGDPNLPPESPQPPNSRAPSRRTFASEEAGEGDRVLERAPTVRILPADDVPDQVPVREVVAEAPGHGHEAVPEVPNPEYWIEGAIGDESMSDITEEEAAEQIASLSDEDLEQRLRDLQESKRAAMANLEDSALPDKQPLKRGSSIPQVALDQNLKAKRCPGCGLENAEIARICSACDEPLGRIIVP